jgi:hypothetical protein
MGDRSCLLMALSTLRSEKSKFVLHCMLCCFDDVLVSCPTSGGLAHEGVYVLCKTFNANRKETKKALLRIRQMLSNPSLYSETVVPEQLSAAINYWGLRVLERVQQTQKLLLDVCSEVLTYRPLISHEQLHTLVCVCVQSARTSGLISRYHEEFPVPNMPNDCGMKESMQSMQAIMDILDD